MSTSLLYHAYGLKGVKYNSTKYKKALLYFMEKSPPLWNVVRSVGAGTPSGVRVRSRGCLEWSL